MFMCCCYADFGLARDLEVRSRIKTKTYGARATAVRALHASAWDVSVWLLREMVSVWTCRHHNAYAAGGVGQRHHQQGELSLNALRSTSLSLQAGS